MLFLDVKITKYGMIDMVAFSIMDLCQQEQVSS